MKEAVKFVPVVVLLAATASIFVQERVLAAEAQASSQKMMVIDPKVRDQMMTTTNEMDKQIKELKACLDKERSGFDKERSGSSNPGQPPSAVERAATEAEIQALQRSIQQLREQVENGPHYLDRTNPLRP